MVRPLYPIKPLVPIDRKDSYPAIYRPAPVDSTGGIDLFRFRVVQFNQNHCTTADRIRDAPPQEVALCPRAHPSLHTPGREAMPPTQGVVTPPLRVQQPIAE